MIGSTWWIEEMEQVMKKDYKVIEELAVSACTFDSVLNNSHSVVLLKDSLIASFLVMRVIADSASHHWK